MKPSQNKPSSVGSGMVAVRKDYAAPTGLEFILVCGSTTMPRLWRSIGDGGQIGNPQIQSRVLHRQIRNRLGKRCRRGDGKTMIKATKYSLVRLLVLGLLFIANLSALSQSISEKPLAFETFLKTNLTIESVVFTKESFSNGFDQSKQPGNVSKKKTYFVRVSGKDYLLSVLTNDIADGDYMRLGVDCGRFGGKTWHFLNGTLVISDSKDGETDSQDPATKASVCTIAKFGITQFLGSDAFSYDENKHRFDLINTNIIGGGVTIQLNYSNGVVVETIIRSLSSNPMENHIAYSYDKEFYNGAIPNGFSSFIEIGTMITKVFSVHILQLSVTNGILPATMIDPVTALTTKKIVVLTSKKGSLYTLAGKRILNTSEIMQHKPKVKKHIVLIRVILILITTLGAFIALIAVFKQRQQKKQKGSI